MTELRNFDGSESKLQNSKEMQTIRTKLDHTSEVWDGDPLDIHLNQVYTSPVQDAPLCQKLRGRVVTQFRDPKIIGARRDLDVNNVSLIAVLIQHLALYESLCILIFVGVEANANERQ